MVTTEMINVTGYNKNFFIKTNSNKNFSVNNYNSFRNISQIQDKFIKNDHIYFGNSEKKKISGWRHGLIAAGLAAGLLSSDAQDIEYKIDDVRQSTVFQTASEEVYDPNVTVLAGSRQDQEVVYSRNNYPPISNFYYTMSLIGELIKPEVRSLQEANNPLLQNGMPMLSQRPVQTPGRVVQGWEKGNDNAERYVLLLGGRYIEEKPRMNTLNLLETTLTSPNVFNVPQDNIIRINTAGRDDFYAGFTRLLNRVNNSDDPENVEVMVYFLGHGELTTPIDEQDAEGSRIGELMNGLTEFELKRLANSLPSSAAVTLIMDTCYSGSLIAEHFVETEQNPFKA